MRRSPADHRCTYLVIVDEETLTNDELHEFATYLSFIGVADLDVVIVDASRALERNRRVLRWVGRHIPARSQHRGPGGAIDPMRAAIDVAGCEKVIVADDRVRYGEEALEDM